MSSAMSRRVADVDAALANVLSSEIEFSVTLVDPLNVYPDDLVTRACNQAGKVQTDQISDHPAPADDAGNDAGNNGGDPLVRQALVLPTGTIAIWHSPRSLCHRIAKHAQAVLDLEVSRNDGKQLLAEVESLTSQVMQDFEELSLIRSLASSLKLPETGDDIDQFVLESLRPLATGVGAVSIAAVLQGEEGRNHRAPIWTGAPLISDEDLLRLIDESKNELRMQPLVRNRDLETKSCLAGGLDELIMVQCASEGRLHGWVLACNRVKDEIEDVPWAQLGFTTVQASLMETATNQLAAQLHNIRLLKQKEELFTDVIRALVNAVEARDPYTCGHSERVASFAKCLASKVGFSAAACEQIYLTGLLHDVGKIAIPDGVLQKPNRLNDEERAIIETHTDSGWRILHQLEALQNVLPGVLYHHEQWSGKGYPDQLKGENIPIDGRILAVCDAFDAMTSDRPYRKGMTIEKAIGILKEGAGEYWDPRLIASFVEHIDEIDSIRLSHRPRKQPSRPAPIDGVPVFDSLERGIPTAL